MISFPERGRSRTVMRSNMPKSRWFQTLALALTLWVAAAQAQTSPGERLRAQFAAVRQGSVAATFDRPLYLVSNEGGDRLQGDVYAVLDRPHAFVRQAILNGEQWCTIMILHLNTKYCRASARNGKERLDVGVGRRFDEPLSDVYWVGFDHAIEASAAEFQQVVLRAQNGPLNTSDYRIAVETAPLAEGQTLLHLTYGYSFGFAGRLAMQTYLATVGRDKVGFSIVGKDADGRPQYIGGVRGVVERNTMRYFLAIEAYLGALGLPAAERTTASLQAWWAATERYRRQLHELDRDDYLTMKQHEISRQATEAPPARE